jgi:hypothetical protein
MEITCPSGLRGLIRGMKVKELGEMSDAKLLRTGKIVDRLVDACWEKTTNTGPYAVVTDKLPWDKMLQGDRAWAFLCVRMATFGNEFGFEHTCGNVMCNSKYEIVVKLDELKQKPLPKTSFNHVHDDQPLETVVNGKRVQYRLLRCNSDQQLNNLIKSFSLSIPIAQIVTRITSVEGIESSDTEALIDWVSELPMADGIELRETMESADCGVEMEIEATCINPACGNVEKFDLPLGSGFFQKRKTKSTSKN